MNPSSAVTSSVSSAASLAALAGAVVITIAYAWEGAIATADAAPTDDVWPAAAAVPALAMRDDCDELAPERAPAAAPPARLRTTMTSARGDSGGDAAESAARQHPYASRRCGADEIGSAHVERRIEGLGSGWIISADGVMRMNPYGLSDRHTITVRPADETREFKGRIIGLDPAPGAEAMARAQDAITAPNGPRVVVSPLPPDRSRPVPAAPRPLRKTT